MSDAPGPSKPNTPAAAAEPAKPAPRTLPPKAPAGPTNPFVYLGIPQAVLDWRPSRKSLPSRNMSIFLAVVFGTTGAYIYDRRECKRIQREYIDQVAWMAEAPMPADAFPRRVRVLGARVPDDGELERSSKWFKRYIKPVLVAAATDYTLTTATNPGGLGRTLLTEIRAKRLAEAAAEKQKATFGMSNSAEENITSVLDQRDAAYEAQEMDGGIVVLGRGALKEYLWALRKGYGETIDLREEARLEGLGLSANEKRKDARWEREDEVVRTELDREDAVKGGPFDEPPDEVPVDDSGDNTPSSSPMSYIPYQQVMPQTSFQQSRTRADEEFTGPATLPPREIPPQPPLTLVPFHHAFGWRSWGPKMRHFFNKRSDMRQGGEIALQIINNAHRPLDPPTLRDSNGEVQGLLDDSLVDEVRIGGHKELTFEDGVPTGSKDLDMQFDQEERPTPFRKVYRTLPSAHEYHRRTYYQTELPPRLTVARELASGSREPTKAESKNPPKLESELRKERLENEIKWRRELQGFAVRRSGSGLAWVDGWEDKFRVTLPLGAQERERLRQQKEEWESVKQDRIREYEAAHSVVADAE